MTDLKTISSAIENFNLDVGRYPSSSEGIRALLVCPKKTVGWRGPYIKSMPLDPWKNGYGYRFLGGTRYQIICLGADGKPGGKGEDADLVENG